jgi:hypothetical protein
MNDVQISKRRQWIHDVQERSWVEFLEWTDFIGIGVLFVLFNVILWVLMS